ncbi:hypothetical protein BSKO_05320 [Bryopsis sp. KO-2023]|nr:hypothetical protein BSKO_05320 [Bryopsis sp. KO-2023]
MPGHTPYIMPDGQPLTRYLTLDDERVKKRKGSKKAKNPRAKDLVWNQLVAHRAKLRADGSVDSAAYAELQTVQTVGHRRRRRWMNDRLLRDMAGPMTAKEMEAHFKPPPWGDVQPQSALSEILHETDVWEIFRNIDMDKEARLLKKWELHNAEGLKENKKQKVGPLEYAHEAMEKWAFVDKRSRFALKRTNPHTVLEKEMEILDLQEKDPQEILTIPSQNSYTLSIWRGLAQFHGLAFKAVVEEGTLGEKQVKLKIGGGEDSTSDEEDSELGQDDSIPVGGGTGDGVGELEADPLEITCTDVLLAMQEYRHIGLNEELLAHFVVTQIHGLEEEEEGGKRE